MPTDNRRTAREVAEEVAREEKINVSVLAGSIGLYETDDMTGGDVYQAALNTFRCALADAIERGINLYLEERK